ncbi:DeoR/GlpR family DNA-binding transcription regulator [Bosea sp. (in: a-proteobacteria)]|uniref:DeoR/GlpR family DNA-binding transcription regulator n=1 Tax=Bosea sp. (in: a-proteobacteria) TaxID=1871050 RepID=UPI00260A21AD|nr:DeoR/GlpR family DNA-binding transcription regulator [Bosea sp. (in: a-proteobacteria)]MCO5093592.1 DeoR/GlpR family DNA-binding transcription regulator [Bosea sp. (in: a-proteobacteria)]
MSKKSVRHEKILAALDRNPALRVNELSDEFGVSSETIRRDLAVLDEAGKISRTYGGAVRNVVFEPGLAERLKLQVRERWEIAEAALSLLDGVDTLFIGGGSTVLHFARALRRLSRPLYVLTPSFSVAMELSSNPRMRIMSLPGLFDGSEGLVHGPDTLAAIGKYSAPVAVLGVSGIDERGASGSFIAGAQVYSAMVEQSRRSLILADALKFDKRALVDIATWTPNIHLVTDSHPGRALSEAIKAGNAQITVASESK